MDAGSVALATQPPEEACEFVWDGVAFSTAYFDRRGDGTLALQGHSHMGERLRMEDGGITRFHTAPAVAPQDWAPWPNGIVVYTVTGDSIDDGDTLILEER